VASIIRWNSGPPIVGRGRAGFDIVGDDLPAARRAITFRLAALVRDGKIVVGLPADRDSQVEGSTNRHRHGNLQSKGVSGGSKTIRQTDRRTRPRTPRSRPR